jgi:hypothetical protein
MADAVKQLKIKTGSVNRCMKDRTASDKEIEKQQQRIEAFKADAHKDHHDVAKQVRCAPRKSPPSLSSARC